MITCSGSSTEEDQLHRPLGTGCGKAYKTNKCFPNMASVILGGSHHADVCSRVNFFHFYQLFNGAKGG